MPARSRGVSARQAGNAALARATASSACSIPASRTSASTCSVAGSITLSVAPVLVALFPSRSSAKWPYKRSITVHPLAKRQVEHRAVLLTYFESLSPIELLGEGVGAWPERGRLLSSVSRR